VHYNSDMLIAKISKNIFLILTIFVILVGTYVRVGMALKASAGGDYNTHIRAVTEFVSGINPYIWTVHSYQNLAVDPGDKGYAYFPGILYVNTILFLFDLFLQFKLGTYTSLPFLMQLPSILATVFVAVFFIKFFNKRNNLAMLFCTFYWFYNPYLLSRKSDLGYDAVSIALLLWALYFLEKDDVLSSFLFSLGVIFKTFPIIALLIFLLKAKSKFKFIVVGLIIYFIFSLPFFRSIDDLITYIRGSLLVHGDRFVQGRPYLYYIAYYWRIEFFRIIPFKFYSISAVITGWIWPFILRIKSLVMDKYKQMIFPFLSFYILTPVLNRTYLVWAIPFFLIGSYMFFEKKHKWAFYVVNLLYWIFSYWYLIQWKDGFHIWRPVY
jgi:hypothetical protein